jgi:hypothetical protein
MRRSVALPFLVLTLLTLGAGRAAADPVTSPHAEPFDVVCGGQIYTVVTSGSAAHVLGSPAMLIPATFEEVVTSIDPATGGEVTETFAFGVGRGHRIGQQAGLTTCTFTESFLDDAGNPVTIEGTVQLFVTPRGR